jgi:1-acyl-sn-glycerol-3-phosphate acyltransferase
MVDRPVTFAAKSEYFSGTRLIDRATAAYMRATKQLSVDRAGARAGQDMLEAALGLLRQGGLFGIYPEGTRSPDGRLYRGRVGVGWLALQSGLPVIPVAMSGTDRVLPPGHKVPRFTSIGITIGEPLTFDAYRGQPCGARQRRAVTDEVMKSIQALSGQEYVPIYASVRKEQLAAANGGMSEPLGRPGGERETQPVRTLRRREPEGKCRSSRWDSRRKSACRPALPRRCRRRPRGRRARGRQPRGRQPRGKQHCRPSPHALAYPGSPRPRSSWSAARRGRPRAGPAPSAPGHWPTGLPLLASEPGPMAAIRTPWARGGCSLG